MFEQLYDCLESSHYFRGRAEDELAAAQGATHPEAMRAHYLLAGYYFDLAHNAEPSCVG